MKRSIIGVLCSLLMLVATSGWATDGLQMQPSTDGSLEVTLIRAQVRNNVLTLQFRLKSVVADKAKYSCFFKNIYFTDIKNSKKYYGLRDAEGNYIAGPVQNSSSGGTFLQWFRKHGQQSLLWIKFPAPPVDTEKIDIYLPKVLPFEGIKISRED